MSDHKIALGTAQFGLNYGIANQHGKITDSEGVDIISYAFEQGIGLLDSAIGYGESEATLGRLGVKRFNIVTKLPPLPDNLTDVHGWVKRQVESSMTRLGVNGLYGFLLHRSQNLKGESGKKLANVLMEIKSEGIVEKIGVSIYDPSELYYATRTLDIDLVQAPMNLVDRRLETSGWLGRLKKMGIEVHTRSAFLQGLLLMPRAEIPAKFELWSDLWDAWVRRLDELGVSPMEACLGYPLSHPEVDRVVIGVDSLAHLTELMQAASKSPTTETWEFMAIGDEQLINPFRWSEICADF